MSLESSNQCMTDFMVCNCHFFLVGENSVFLLIACDDHFNGFFQICLGCELSAITDCSQRCFVDDICQFSTGSTACHPGNHLEVYIICNLDFLGVNTEDFFSAIQIGQFHRNPAVKSTGTG